MRIENVFSLRLKHKLSCFWVFGDVRSQTDSTGTLARRVLPSRDKLINVLQQLWLTGTRITTQKDVDVWSVDGKQIPLKEIL